jgi:hypothetical protein
MVTKIKEDLYEVVRLPYSKMDNKTYMKIVIKIYLFTFLVYFLLSIISITVYPKLEPPGNPNLVSIANKVGACVC